MNTYSIMIFIWLVTTILLCYFIARKDERDYERKKKVLADERAARLAIDESEAHAAAADYKELTGKVALVRYDINTDTFYAYVDLDDQVMR